MIWEEHQVRAVIIAVEAFKICKHNAQKGTLVRLVIIDGIFLFIKVNNIFQNV